MFDKIHAKYYFRSATIQNKMLMLQELRDELRNICYALGYDRSVVGKDIDIEWNDSKINNYSYTVKYYTLLGDDIFEKLLVYDSLEKI